MPATYRDVESSCTTGSAKFRAWQEEWEGNFLKPLIEDMMRKALMRLMTPENMYALMQSDPDAFERTMQFIGVQK